MKKSPAPRRGKWSAALGALLLAACCAFSAELSEAEKAWEEFQVASRPPPTPKEWRTQRPSEKEYKEYLDKVRQTLAGAVDKARDFYTRFPNDPNAPRARRKEYEFLTRLHSMGKNNTKPACRNWKNPASPTLP